MFCATVLYPNEPDVPFDFELYAGMLAPEYANVLGENCTRFEVRKGLTTPGAPAPRFVCIASFWVESAEMFGASLGDPRMPDLMARISAFTAVQPIRQFDEVVVKAT
jgi:hypothetical protein